MAKIVNTVNKLFDYVLPPAMAGMMGFIAGGEAALNKPLFVIIPGGIALLWVIIGVLQSTMTYRRGMLDGAKEIIDTLSEAAEKGSATTKRGPKVNVHVTDYKQTNKKGKK